MTREPNLQLKKARWHSNPVIIFIKFKRLQGTKHSGINWDIVRKEYDYCETNILER